MREQFSLALTLLLLAACPGADDTTSTTDAQVDSGATSTASTNTADTTAGSSTPSCAAPEPIVQAGGSPTGFERCEDGRVIYVAPATCENPGSAGSCQDPSRNGSCVSDDECTAGSYGRCDDVTCGPGGCGCGCSYGCETNADCGAGQVCACGAPGFLGRSLCIPASCTGAGDCGEGQCQLGSNAFGCSLGYRVDCTTPEDACVLPNDCGDFQSCYPQGGVWTCVEDNCG